MRPQRERDRFGLELTNDMLVNRDRDKLAPLSVFHGKELDRLTSFSSFGARYYSRDIGMWLKPDPMLRSYLDGTPNEGVFAPPNLNSFAYAHNRPTIANDPNGEWVNIAVGAAIGGLLGGGIELGRQMYVGEVDLGRVTASTVGGMVAGGIAGATFGASLIAEVGIAGASSAAGAATTRALLGESTSAADVAQDTLVGIATLGLVKGGGSFLRTAKNAISSGGEAHSLVWSTVAVTPAFPLSRRGIVRENAAPMVFSDMLMIKSISEKSPYLRRNSTIALE
jgi:RHS repeat-associated protein